MIGNRALALKVEVTYALGMRVLVVALVLVPVASAVPLDANLLARGPVDLEGHLAGDLEVISAEIMGDGELISGAGAMKVVVSKYEQANVHAHDLPGPWPEHSFQQATPVNEISWEVNGNWSVRAKGPDAMVRLLGPPGRLAYQAHIETDRGLALSAPRDDAPANGPAPFIDGEATKVDGPHQSANAVGATVVNGRFRAVLHNATLVMGDGGSYAAEVRPRGTNASIGNADAWTTESTYVLLHFDGVARFDRAHVLITGMDADVDGRIVVQQVAGTTRAEGLEWNREASLVVADGAFSAWSQSVDARQSRWSLQGDAQRIAVNGSIAFYEATVVGAGAILLVFLLKCIPSLVAWLGRHRAAPLQSETRRRILEFIEANPGCRRTDIAKQLHTTRHNVMFHISVLRHHELIDVFQRGRFQHYMPNSGTYRKVIPAKTGAVRLRDVLAALDHPLRSRIAQLLSEGPQDYAGLITSWGEGAPSKSLLSYHMNILRDKGLVNMGSTRQWALTTDIGPTLGAAKQTARAAYEKRGVQE